VENLLKKLFEKSIELGDIEYSEKEINSTWIGNSPTTKEMINKVEEKLKASFPEDYKELLLITNGFKTSNNAVEPSFMKIGEVDYLKNIDPFVVECYEDTLEELSESILIGGRDEEQYFLIIPPKDEKENWRYWKFANWIPGEEEYKDLGNW
jgi:cell wall assembly regulator SMI1